MDTEILEIPVLLSSFLKNLQKEGLYIEFLNKEDKENKAISAMNQAIQEAMNFSKIQDLSLAAKSLEKIQVAAAEAERAAFITHNEKAIRSSRMAIRIASYVRNLFHQMKLVDGEHCKAA